MKTTNDDTWGKNWFWTHFFYNYGDEEGEDETRDGRKKKLRKIEIHFESDVCAGKSCFIEIISLHRRGSGPFHCLSLHIDARN